MTRRVDIFDVVLWNVIFLAFLLAAGSGFEMVFFGSGLASDQLRLHKLLREVG